MPRFDDRLSQEESEAIQDYVVDRTRKEIAFCATDVPARYPELFATACARRVAAPP